MFGRNGDFKLDDSQKTKEREKEKETDGKDGEFGTFENADDFGNFEEPAKEDAFGNFEESGQKETAFGNFGDVPPQESK
jgi:hypothetical protein